MDESNITIDGEENMQLRIESALNPEKQANVKTLNLQGEECDETFPVTLRHRVSNLTTLNISNVHITKLHLSGELTPMLTDLELVSVPDNCDFKVNVPTLKNISIQFLELEDDAGPINAMLAAATCLERFHSYKLWVHGGLKFASNQLKIINLHRSDGLRAISIWAPNLQQLGLQACYSIEMIQILNEHPKLSKELPAGHKPSTFTVNAGNAVLSGAARKALKESGRSFIEVADLDNSDRDSDSGRDSDSD